jgi:hypothetical protein
LPQSFRDLLYDLSEPRLADARDLDARAFGKAMRDHPLAGQLIAGWDDLYAQPFHGLTCDGHKQHGLFSLADEGAPTAAMVQAANALLAALDGDQRARLMQPIESNQWRAWSNPEFLINDLGLRLEDLAAPHRAAILTLVEASMSAKGYDKSRGCMHTNAFLGQLCDLPALMNEWSYNFQLFGEPSLTGPWGWNLYGHHLCLNCFVLGGQMVISPTFMGAEPNFVDEGPHAGTRLFVTEETEGLNLMRSLSKDLQERARLYPTMQNDPAMPPGRWHPADGLHMGGAFQDNRIVPYEGIKVSEFSAAQKDRLLGIVEAFIEYLPDTPRAARMRQIESHIDNSWWCWIGGQGDEDPFYYRVQSPVIMVEFDHHAGIWLNNQAPAKCHIHTVVRTPNGNDYGKDLLRQHYADIHPGKLPGRDD